MLSTCVSLVIGIASGDRRYRRALGDGTAQRLHYAQQTHMLSYTAFACTGVVGLGTSIIRSTMKP
jgi:hypothetical protein